jgi:hypothetical protein
MSKGALPTQKRELQSTGGDTQPSSERLTCRACYTPASPKTIQSP